MRLLFDFRNPNENRVQSIIIVRIIAFTEYRVTDCANFQLARISIHQKIGLIKKKKSTEIAAMMMRRRGGGVGGCWWWWWYAASVFHFPSHIPSVSLYFPLAVSQKTIGIMCVPALQLIHRR